MERSRKIVLISHCLLNVNAKVEGLATVPSASIDLITGLMKMGVGIVQLPCVEQDMCGIRRWGQVEEQLNHPNFRKRCHELLTPIINQIKDFLDNGYKICGIIGIDGSPSCGVNITCSGDWYGEIGEAYNVLEKAKTVREKKSPGVMIQVLKEMLVEEKINVEFFAVNEAAQDENVKNILHELKILSN